MHHIYLWILFWVVVITALGLDLFILNKHHGHVSIKDASVININDISFCLAPNDLNNPISRLRSLTEIYVKIAVIIAETKIETNENAKRIVENVLTKDEKEAVTLSR